MSSQALLPGIQYVPELRRGVAEAQPQTVDDRRRVLLPLLPLLLLLLLRCRPAPRAHGRQLAQSAVQPRYVPLDPRREVRDLGSGVVERAGPPSERREGLEALARGVDPRADGRGAASEVGLGGGGGGGRGEGGGVGGDGGGRGSGGGGAEGSWRLCWERERGGEPKKKAMLLSSTFSFSFSARQSGSVLPPKRTSCVRHARRVL